MTQFGSNRNIQLVGPVTRPSSQQFNPVNIISRKYNFSVDYFELRAQQGPGHSHPELYLPINGAGDIYTHNASEFAEAIHEHEVADITDFPSTMPPSEHDHDDLYFTKQEVTDDIALGLAGLVGVAPATLDTLQELGDALGDDPNFATTMTTALGNKVDKESGKSLLADTEASKIHSSGSDAETAESIMALGIDEIEFALINSFRI